MPVTDDLMAAYAVAPRRDRAHVRVRWRSCPFEQIATYVPTTGSILDVGSGHGGFALFLALQSPDRRVTGVDVDGDKIAVAEKAAAEAGADNAAFHTIAPGQVPDGPWDAITIADVLYLLGEAEARDLLVDLAGRLAPGGALVVKETDTQPRWKHLATMAQELVAVRIARVTQGHCLQVLPAATVASILRQSGLTTEVHRLDRRRLYPHYLAVGRRPADQGTHARRP